MGGTKTLIFPRPNIFVKLVKDCWYYSPAGGRGVIAGGRHCWKLKTI